MDWYIVDKKNVNYLRSYDSKVENVEYGDKLKLHVGILIEVDGFKYYVPVSSPKPKHAKMKNGIDFHKLVDSSDGTLYAVININNMIPVPDSCVTQLKYNVVQKYRSFIDEKDKTNYIYLLQKEKYLIDSVEETLVNKAKKLFNKVKSDPDSSLAKRCCDFVKLEKAASLFEKSK